MGLRSFPDCYPGSCRSQCDSDKTGYLGSPREDRRPGFDERGLRSVRGADGNTSQTCLKDCTNFDTNDTWVLILNNGAVTDKIELQTHFAGFLCGLVKKCKDCKVDPWKKCRTARLIHGEEVQGLQGLSLRDWVLLQRVTERHLTLAGLCRCEALRASHLLQMLFFRVCVDSEHNGL